MHMNRAGMTLVELLIAMVAASVVMGAAYQVLVTNQRVYMVQREQILGQQTVRAGSEVLFSELRQVSPPEGDLLTIDEQQVEFRAMRAFGLVCGVGMLQTSLNVLVEGEAFEDGQVAFAFSDDDPSLTSDDEWVSATIDDVDSDPTACPQGGDVQVLTLLGLALSDLDGVREGAPVRSAETFTYGAFQFDGDWYLGRAAGSGSAVPLVGPLDSRDGEPGLAFTYLDEDGAETTVPGEVRRVRVMLRTASAVTDQFGNTVSDSLTADVFLRN